MEHLGERLPARGSWADSVAAELPDQDAAEQPDGQLAALPANEFPAAGVRWAHRVLDPAKPLADAWEKDAGATVCPALRKKPAARQREAMPAKRRRKARCLWERLATAEPASVRPAWTVWLAPRLTRQTQKEAPKPLAAVPAAEEW